MSNILKVKDGTFGNHCGYKGESKTMAINDRAREKKIYHIKSKHLNVKDKLQQKKTSLHGN